MPDTSQITPFTASCGGGLVLNKDVFTMHPGEAFGQTLKPLAWCGAKCKI